MLDDSVLDHEIFNDPEEAETAYTFDHSEEFLKKAGITYPSFVEFETPKEVHTISLDPETGWFVASGVEASCASIEELYDFIREELKHDVVFDESVKDSDQVSSNIIGMIFCTPKPGAKGARMLIGHVDNKNLECAQYYSFLKLAKRWTENKDDFVTAFSFLQGHPVFWYRHNIEKHPYSWETDNGLESLWIYPTRNKEGNTVVMMEHGASVPPHRTMHYHDFRFDVYESTYEKGIIELAKRVHKFYYLDGDERPNVDYEKSALEIELEERLADYNEGTVEDTQFTGPNYDAHPGQDHEDCCK